MDPWGPSPLRLVFVVVETLGDRRTAEVCPPGRRTGADHAARHLLYEYRLLNEDVLQEDLK